MAKGDYHVEQKSGGWRVEVEGMTKSSREPVELLANRDQAWRVAVFYAQSSGVDVFLHDGRTIAQEKRFREKRRRR